MSLRTPSRTTTDDDDSEGEDEAVQVASKGDVDDAVMIGGGGFDIDDGMY